MHYRKPLNFIQSQLDQIRKGGLPVLLRKSSTLIRRLCEIPLIMLAIPVALVVRILRPWLTVRFGFLHSERIGHFAYDTELYLCERDTGMDGSQNFDVFYYVGKISNYQLKKMWDRSLRLWSFAKWIDKANRLLPGWQSQVIAMSSTRDIHGLLGRNPPHISFTAEEEKLGQEGLRKIGIPDASPFVCFAARDSSYLDKARSDRNWDYHKYRNSDIHTYLPATEELTRRRYFAIRVGAIVEKKLNISNPRIIDYAVNGREDFLDIYLGAKCQFFICDTAGIHAVAEIFRRPIAWVNFIPLEYVYSWGANQLFIPKKLWLRKERRFLTFREILDSGIGRFLESKEYERAGIEAIDNTPEEITALAVEMDERLKGEWRSTEEDKELQQRFWGLFKPNDLNRIFLSRIGAQFLRQNRQLLE